MPPETTEHRRSGILDVAARAQVSRQTVTRAMNDMPGISAATKQRVLEAARELAYRPSRFGRGLVTRGTPALGLVVVDLTNGFWAELASCVLDEAAERGWTVLIAEASHDVRSAVGNLIEHVDAVFGLIDLPDEEIDERFGSTPLLLLDRPDVAGRAAIHLDFESAMDEAVTHLQTRGRRRVVMLDWARDEVMSHRAQQFAEAAVRQGLEPQVLHDVTSREPSIELGRLAASVAVERWPDADAFVCFNDYVAVGAMKHLQSEGVDVSGDVSVVGIDGSALGLVVTPELTTLRFDLREVARIAVDAAVGMVEGRTHSQGSDVQWTVTPTLTVRQSS